MIPTDEQVREMFPRDDFVKTQQLDFRREGQPISTDEFLIKILTNARLCEVSKWNRLVWWSCGSFSLAMDGLE